MKQLPRLSENFFSENTRGYIDIEDNSIDFLNVDWFSEHATGYHIPDTKSKYRGFVLIMFEFDGELCWFRYSSRELKSMNVHLR